MGVSSINNFYFYLSRLASFCHLRSCFCALSLSLSLTRFFSADFSQPDVHTLFFFSLSAVHFAQLDWNLLHQIWDFTPAFVLSLSLFSAAFACRNTQTANCILFFPHDVGTFFSRLFARCSFFVWIFFIYINTRNRAREFMRLEKIDTCYFDVFHYWQLL